MAKRRASAATVGHTATKKRKQGSPAPPKGRKDRTRPGANKRSKHGTSVAKEAETAPPTPPSYKDTAPAPVAPSPANAADEADRRQTANARHSKLLQLPKELLDSILQDLDTHSVSTASRACRKFLRAGKPHMFRSMCFRLGYLDEGPFMDRQAMAAKFVRHLQLFVLQNEYAQECFVRLMSCLRDTPLQSFIFGGATVRRPLVTSKGAQHGVSTLNSRSLAILSEMLKSPKYARFRSKLTQVEFPLCDDTIIAKCTKKNEDPTTTLGLLDSDVTIEFESTKLLPGSSIRVVAQGYPKRSASPANGTPTDVVRHFIHDRGISSEIRTLTMGGTPVSDLNEWHDYADPLSLFQLVDAQQLARVTNLILRDYDMSSLPNSLFASLDYSEIKKLHLIQCTELTVIWDCMIRSRHPLGITDLKIHIYDQDYQSQSMSNFIQHFKSLEVVSIKTPTPWTLPLQCFWNHQNLRIAHFLGKPYHLRS